LRGIEVRCRIFGRSLVASGIGYAGARSRREHIELDQLASRTIAFDAFHTIYYFLTMIRHRTTSEPLKDHQGITTFRPARLAAESFPPPGEKLPTFGATTRDRNGTKKAGVCRSEASRDSELVTA
jgi:hypothetical protein